METKNIEEENKYKHIKLNYKRDTKDKRDLLFAPLMAPGPISVPPKVNLGPNMPPVLNQGNLGSCVSNAVANALRYCLHKEKVFEFDPSRLFIYYNGRVLANYPAGEDSGLSLRDGAKSVATYSAPAEPNWPYEVDKFDQKPPDAAYSAALKHKKLKYFSVPAQGPVQLSLKKTLAQNYPITFGVEVFESFMSPEVVKTGLVPAPGPDEQSIGGHAILMCGYDNETNLFKFQNSWGASWGQDGFGYLSYDYVSKYAHDFWTFQYFD